MQISISLSASAFIETTLAQIYKKRDSDGGPSCYIEQSLGKCWLGVVFTVELILTFMVGNNMLASCNFLDTLSTFSFNNESPHRNQRGAVDLPRRCQRRLGH